MAADASPYSILGLAPGADPAAIDRAYKDLIKRHHPDRAGGDSARAAEINRAYLELRGPRASGRDLVLADPEPFQARQGSRTRWLWAVLAVAALAGLAWYLSGPIAPLDGRQSSFPSSASTSRDVPHDIMDRPLATTAIDQSVREVVRIARSKDEVALATASRDCHRRLRIDPSLDQLDRCAAFDDAVVLLQDRDPLRNRGPFGELEVTGRQMGAASALSDDSLAIDGRLDRIRLHVELALVPRLPPLPPPPVPPAEADVSD